MQWWIDKHSRAHICNYVELLYIPATNTAAAGTATATATTVTDVGSTALVGPDGIVDGIGDTVAVTWTKIRINFTSSCHTPMKKTNDIWYTCSKKSTTVFAWSDAAATIYFITQFCVATNRECRLLNSVLLVKSFVNARALRNSSFINKELQCGDFVLKQAFQLLD